jgi:hypothetical protein
VPAEGIRVLPADADHRAIAQTEQGVAPVEGGAVAGLLHEPLILRVGNLGPIEREGGALHDLLRALVGVAGIVAEDEPAGRDAHERIAFDRTLARICRAEKR